jgi:hypothetical protein
MTDREEIEERRKNRMTNDEEEMENFESFAPAVWRFLASVCVWFSWRKFLCLCSLGREWGSMMDIGHGENSREL